MAGLIGRENKSIAKLEKRMQFLEKENQYEISKAHNRTDAAIKAGINVATN